MLHRCGFRARSKEETDQFSELNEGAVFNRVNKKKVDPKALPDLLLDANADDIVGAGVRSSGDDGLDWS